MCRGGAGLGFTLPTPIAAILGMGYVTLMGITVVGAVSFVGGLVLLPWFLGYQGYKSLKN